MAELFDKDGNLVEAYTPDEVNAKLDDIRKEAAEDAKTELQDTMAEKDEQLADLQGKLAAAEADLAGEQNKDKNLGGQRKIIEGKEKVIEELTKKIADLETNTNSKLDEIGRKEHEKMIITMIDDLTDGDQELSAKVKFHFDNFKSIDEKDKKPEEIQKIIQERIKNAYTLATGGKTTPLSGPIISSAGGGKPTINESGEKINPEVQDLAHKLGVTDQDLKKHKLI
jgi:type VI protein secretion system component VasK